MSEIKFRRIGCVIIASSIHCSLMKFISSIKTDIVLTGGLESNLCFISMSQHAEAGFELEVRIVQVYLHFGDSSWLFS